MGRDNRVCFHREPNLQVSSSNTTGGIPSGLYTIPESRLERPEKTSLKEILTVGIGKLEGVGDGEIALESFKESEAKA